MILQQTDSYISPVIEVYVIENEGIIAASFETPSDNSESIF